MRCVRKSLKWNLPKLISTKALFDVPYGDLARSFLNLYKPRFPSRNNIKKQLFSQALLWKVYESFT